MTSAEPRESEAAFGPGPASTGNSGGIRRLLGRSTAHPVARILGIFAISRAVVLLVLLVIREASIVPPVTGGITDLLCRFDCKWYGYIAAWGYSTESISSRDATAYAYFPLYPTLVGILSSLTGLSVWISGIILSSACFVAALIYIYYYARDLGFGHRTGILSVTILCFAPPTFVFSSILTEALFMLLLAAAVFHLRRGEFLRAGVAAALVSATRANGIAFLAFALIWVFRRYGIWAYLRPWLRPEVFLPIVLAPLGLFAFWAFSYTTTGDAFASATTNVHGWGWGITSAFEQLTNFGRLDPSDKILIAISGATLGLTTLLLRYRLFEEFGLCLASLAIVWTGGLAAWSMPRFAIVLFPLAVVVARTVATRPGVATILVAAAATISGFLLAVGWAMGAFVI